MPYQQINGISTSYQEHGERTKAPDVIVMIHGWGLDSTVWGKLTALLELHFFIVTYDLRAHGQTDNTEEPITWEQLGEDLRQLMEKLDLHQVHLLAFGYGTHLATKFTLRYPGHVRSLILLSMPYMSENNNHFHLAKHVFPAIQTTMESGNPYFLRQYQELLKGYTTLNADDPQLLHYFRVLLGRPMPHISHLIQLASNSTLLTELSLLPCPVMLMTGELNVTSPTGLFNASSFLLKQPTQISISNASFLFFLEQPVETAKWIHLFVSKKCPRLSQDSPNSKSEISQVIHSIFQPIKQVSENQKHLLDIQLLHTFHVEIDSIPITTGWNQRYAKRLLIYLVFHPVTTREILCEEFFPDVSPVKALANLKVYLNHLEKLLRHPKISARGLLFHQGTVSMQYQIKCDLMDLIAAIDQAYYEQDPTIRFQLCEKLFEFFEINVLPHIQDDWVIRFRNRVEAQVYELMDWMAIQCTKQGLYSRSTSYYIHMLQYHPDEEHIYDRIIELLRLSGDYRTMAIWERKKAGCTW
ncbi:alpha/beta fold hydrolase [Cohnella hongkongensis]|uniref:Alpha/beta fold hydrolase n=1 Tax=Cohnella hongkongensis TaxID=178337 RepID=A0ABV9FEV7_9BACL